MKSKSSIVSQFFSGTIFIGIARVSSIVLGFVSVMIATRYLSTDAYGAYVLVLLFSNFLVQFMSFGLGLVIPKYLAGGEENDNEYETSLINTVFYFRVAVVFSTVTLIVIFRPLLSGFVKSPLIADIFKATPIMFAVVSFANLFQSVLRGQLKVKSIGVVEFFSELAKLAFLFLFVVAYELGFWGLVAAKIIGQIIWAFSVYRAVNFKHKWEFNFQLLKEMLKFGLPLQVQYFFDFIYTRLDTIIIGSLLGTRGVALYDIARKIPDSLLRLYAVFVSVYFPISANVYAKKTEKKTGAILNNSIRLLTFLSLFAALIVFIFGKGIIALLFSEEYLPVYWVLVLLMIGVTIDMVEEILGYLLVAIGEPDKPLYINIIRAIFSVIGNVIILPILGFMGAAIVYIFGNLVAIPVDDYFLRRKKISPGFIVIIKQALIFGLLGGLFWLWNPDGFLPKAIIALLYIPGSLLLCVITLDDMSIVYSEVRIFVGKIFHRSKSTP
jgi:O-antigen/teichoic acid export membrane protein